MPNELTSLERAAKLIREVDSSVDHDSEFARDIRTVAAALIERGTPAPEELTTAQKCEAILRKVRDIVNDGFNEGKAGEPVIFETDWGGNSLTVVMGTLGHTHAGIPDGSWDDLVDSLHGIFCRGRGLSLAL